MMLPNLTVTDLAQKLRNACYRQVRPHKEREWTGLQIF